MMQREGDSTQEGGRVCGGGEEERKMGVGGGGAGWHLFCGYDDTLEMKVPREGRLYTSHAVTCDPTFQNESHWYFLSFSGIYVRVESAPFPLKWCKDYQNQFIGLIIIIVWSRNHHSISFWEMGKVFMLVLSNKWVHVYNTFQWHL